MKGKKMATPSSEDSIPPIEERSRHGALRRFRAALSRWPRLTKGVAIVLASVAAVAALVMIVEVANRPSLAAVQVFDVPPGHTDEPVDYPQRPGVSGMHSPVWLNCGIYDQPVRDENAVHSMEHGAVWVAYRPDLSAEDVALLRRTLPQTYIIVSPYPGLTAPVVANAWAHRLELSGADDKRLPAFVEEFRQGVTTPEPGGPCVGGTSEVAR